MHSKYIGYRTQQRGMGTSFMKNSFLCGHFRDRNTNERDQVQI